MSSIVVALAILAAAVPGYASTFASGDLLIGKPFAAGIDWRDPAGTLIQSIGSGDTTGMRTSPITGQLWVTKFSGTVSVYDTQGNLTATYPTPGLSTSESIVFDSGGNAYIGGADVLVSAQARVIKLSPAGALLRTYTVPREDRGSDWVDLCRDNRTLFYTSEGTKILRYDVVDDLPLPEFADLTGFVNPSGGGTALFAVRVLRDGNVLVAGINDLYLLDPQGQVIRNYITPSLNAFFSLAVTPSGKEFWVQGTGPGAIVFDIATGALLTSFSLGTVSGATTGIAIVDDRTRGSCTSLCVRPPAGLIGWWPLDETAPSTAHERIFGSDGTHQTKVGPLPSPTAGMVANGLSFEHDDYVSVPDNSHLDLADGDFTIDAWARVDVIGDESPLVAKGVDFFSRYDGPTDTGFEWGVSTVGPTQYLALGSGAAKSFHWYENGPLDGSPASWHHLAVVVHRKGGGTPSVTFYEDGLAFPDVSGVPPISGSLTTPSPLVFAEFGGTSGYQDEYTGILDEVEIFDRALSGGEIMQLSSAGAWGKCKHPTRDAPTLGEWPGIAMTLLLLATGSVLSMRRSAAATRGRS